MVDEVAQRVRRAHRGPASWSSVTAATRSASRRAAGSRSIFVVMGVGTAEGRGSHRGWTGVRHDTMSDLVDETSRGAAGCALTRWLDRFQQRHPVLGFPIAVIYKFAEDQGPYLAALITYYGFLSLFPLLLLLASVLGFVLQDDPDLQERILDSTLSQFPIIGQQLGEPQGLQGSTVAVVVGGLVALYGALGVAQALQNAVNVSWAVPRNNRPNPVRARLRSMLLLLTAGFAVIATTVLSVLGGAAANEGVFSGTGAAPGHVRRGRRQHDRVHGGVPHRGRHQGQRGATCSQVRSPRR